MADNEPVYIVVRRSDVACAYMEHNRTDLLAVIADPERWDVEDDVTHVVEVSERGAEIMDRDRLDRDVEEFLADAEAERRHRAGLRAGAR